MRFIRALTRLKAGVALLLLGVPLALLPIGLSAVGYKVSPVQGYAILVLAGLFAVAAIVVLFWPWTWGAWLWIRREAEFQEVQEALRRLDARLGEIQQECASLRLENHELRAMSPEEFRFRQDERRKRIERWRAEIRASDFKRTARGTSHFALTEAYSEMSPHLPADIRARYESPFPVLHVFLAVPRKQGSSGDKRVLLDEVAQIEERWGLI